LPFTDFEQLQGKYKCSYAEWNGRGEESGAERGLKTCVPLCCHNTFLLFIRSKYPASQRGDDDVALPERINNSNCECACLCVCLLVCVCEDNGLAGSTAFRPLNRQTNTQSLSLSHSLIHTHTHKYRVAWQAPAVI